MLKGLIERTAKTLVNEPDEVQGIQDILIASHTHTTPPCELFIHIKKEDR